MTALGRGFKVNRRRQLAIKLLFHTGIDETGSVGTRRVLNCLMLLAGVARVEAQHVREIAGNLRLACQHRRLNQLWLLCVVEEVGARSPTEEL